MQLARVLRATAVNAHSNIATHSWIAMLITFELLEQPTATSTHACMRAGACCTVPSQLDHGDVALLGQLGGHVGRAVRAGRFSRQELVNMAWSMAVLDLEEAPLINEVLRALQVRLRHVQSVYTLSSIKQIDLTTYNSSSMRVSRGTFITVACF
jgi:hypothetical protein